MTGRTRDYLADLANRKGIKLDDEQNRSQAWASGKIEELKALPDVNFPELTVAQKAQIGANIERVITEVDKWILA